MKIGTYTPNSCPTTWGAIVRSGNCLVVFHNPFFPFQPLFKLTKISLQFTFTPALSISSWFCELTELVFVMIPYISSTGYPPKRKGLWVCASSEFEFALPPFCLFSPVSRPRTQTLSLFILAAILNKFLPSVDKLVT